MQEKQVNKHSELPRIQTDEPFICLYRKEKLVPQPRPSLHPHVPQQNFRGLQEQDGGMVSYLVFSTLSIMLPPLSGFRYVSLTLTLIGTQLLLELPFCDSVTIQFLLL